MFTAYSDLASADERLKTASRATFCIFLQFTELIDDVRSEEIHGHLRERVQRRAPVYGGLPGATSDDFDLDCYSDFEFFCIRDR